MRPKLSILIVNWNSWEHIRRCLTTLRIDDLPDSEVVIIDNASMDGSAAKIRQEFPGVILRENERHLGHAGGMNQGFRIVQGQYVLILDPDTELHRDSLCQLISFMDSRPDISMVTPRTYSSDGSIQESARGFPSAMSGLFGRQSRLSKWFPNNRFTRRYLMRERLSDTEPYPVGQISASCMLLRRELLDEVGLWDEGYRAYFVDTDWCMTVRKHGKLIYCLPTASIIHHENNRAGAKRSPKRIRIFHRGALRFYRKHYTLGWPDPRTWLAAVALGLRMAVLLAVNAMKPAAQTAGRTDTQAMAEPPKTRDPAGTRKDSL